MPNSFIPYIRYKMPEYKKIILINSVNKIKKRDNNYTFTTTEPQDNNLISYLPIINNVEGGMSGPEISIENFK